MAGNLNRAQLRDEIRHQLNRRTLFEQTGNPADIGNGIPAQPWPSNSEINGAINLCIRSLNARANFGVNTDYALPVAAQTGSGAYTFDLNTTAVPSPYLPGSVNEVREAVWTDVSNNFVPLTPVFRQDWDREGRQWQAQGPGTPQNFWLEATLFSLWPAPDVAGTLSLIIGQSLLSFQSDAEYMSLLPSDYAVPYLTYAAAADLAGRRTQDVEMVTAAQRCLALASEEVTNILYWLATNNKQANPTVGFRSYRQGQGLMRVRR